MSKRSGGIFHARKNKWQPAFHYGSGDITTEKPKSYSIHDIERQLELIENYFQRVVAHTRDKVMSKMLGEEKEVQDALEAGLKVQLRAIQKQAAIAHDLCLRRWMKQESHLVNHHPHQGNREKLRRMMKITHGYYHNQPVIHVEGQ